MRLRTVRGDVPLLASNPELLEALETAEIKTTYDVLFTPLPDLLARLATAKGILTTDIITLQEQIATVTAVECTTGDKLYTKELEALDSMRPHNESVFGVQALDDLLGPTFSGPYVVELSGTPGSGKSVLATHVVTRWLAHDPDASALWIDCSGDFTPERAKRVCTYIDLDVRTLPTCKLG
ncbi:hypothetical protein FRC07_000437 [Ceratobasidium sp. 392]|nr:hypothetical protein FRC07_000437 [Ceratobasidium sp. 392]